MFLKIPVYFEVSGTVRDSGFIQECLHLWLQNKLLGEESSKNIKVPWKEAFASEGQEPPKSVSLVSRDRVIKGLK